MSLLRQIQDAAVEAGDIAVALRKAKILASRLNNEDFKRWVHFELNGYPDNLSIAEYRILPAIARGYFSGFGGSSANNVPIPAACLPEMYRDFARKVYIRYGIGTIEAIISDGDKNGALNFPWPPDLVALVGKKIYQGMSCISAWQELTSAAFVGIVDAVRGRLIDFALEIERANPDVGEIKAGEEGLPPERVSQIYNQVFNIEGDANIASGSKHFNQFSSLKIEQGDRSSLAKYLKSIGVSDLDQTELFDALESDPAPKHHDRFGPKVSKWIGKMVGAAAAGVWNASISSAATLLIQAIASYYGLSN
jgi:AbiTii